MCRQVGYPASIRVDNGSEFISRDLDLWAYQKGVVLDFLRPGKPTDNGFIESFNGKFRAECLNTHWFLSLDDARTWQRRSSPEDRHPWGPCLAVNLNDRQDNFGQTVNIASRVQGLVDPNVILATEAIVGDARA